MFVVPKAEGTKKENRFSFKIDKTYTIPFIQFLSGEGSVFLEERGAELSEVALMRRLVAIESPEAADIVRTLSNDQMQALSAAWIDASTADPAKSSASEDSE